MIKRRLYYELQKYLNSKEALVITGMRQVGKTTLLKQIYDEIDSQNKLFLDLENTLTQQIFEEMNYDRIDIQLRKLVKSGKDDKCYLFLDEIQNVKNLPSVIKYLSDHFNYKFFLTGSVSFYLRNLFSESMTGRKFLFELFPLSFSEFLEFKRVKYTKPKLDETIDKTFFEMIQPLFQEYIEYGGFPGVGLANILGKASFGSVFENAVFHELYIKKKGIEDIRFSLNYYQKKSGQEIDFVLNKETAIEVKETADYRDVERLKRLADKLELEERFAVSYNYSKDERIKYGFQL